MKNKELNIISDRMFKDINYYVMHHDFKLEVYDITNDQLNNRLVMNGESLEIMCNFIDYLFRKVITQLIISSKDKTIKAFVREKEL